MNKTNYVDTEIGQIPIDWSLSNIQDLFIKNEKIKIGPFGSQLKKEYLLPSGDYYVYGQENVYKKNFDICYRFLTKERFLRLKTCELRPGDFVVSTMGTIGKCAFVPESINTGIMDSHLVRMRFNEDVYKPFIEFLFESPYVQDQINKLSVGGIMDGLSTSIIKQLNIVLPKPEEQKQIADVLSDVGLLIINLENKRQKIKCIRDGLLKKLLSRQIRLKGFTNEWRDYKIHELANEITDGPFGSDLKTEHYTDKPEARIIQLGNVGVNGWENSNVKYTTFNHAQELKRCIVPSGAIVVAKMMPAGRSIICPNDDLMYIQGSDVVKIILKERFNPKFFVYMTKTKDYLDQIEQNTQGSTRARISVTKLKNITIQMPLKDEQDAIVEILEDFDNEIISIEGSLTKYTSIKNGIMQQLLTGKIRLS